MTKKYKTVTVPEHTEERQAGIVCDLCGKETDRHDWSASHSYEVEEVTVEYKSGYSYPDDYFYTVIEVDLCPQCFKERLVPWLESQGVKPTKREIS